MVQRGYCLAHAPSKLGPSATAASAVQHCVLPPQHRLAPMVVQTGLKVWDRRPATAAIRRFRTPS
jgi:hypothetical protein